MHGYIEILYKNSIPYEEIKLEETNKTIKEYDKNKLKKMRFLEHCFIDFIPKNCFDINGKLSFFDQEWEEKYLPVEYVINRAIKNSILVEKFSEELFDIYKLKDYQDLFENLEEEFRNKVMDHTMLYDIFNRRVPTEAEIIEAYHSIRRNNEEAQNEILELKNKIEALTKENEAIKNSKSWKLTQPIRSFLQLGRGKNK